jgi:hypothetical protein
VWVKQDDAFTAHTSMVATDDRVGTGDGVLLLLDAAAPEFKVVSRVKALEDEKGNLSHQAVANHRLYLRGHDAVYCLALE